MIYDLFNDAPFQQGMINWTRTISPTIVNEARVGVNNIMVWNGAVNKVGDLGKVFNMPGLIGGALPRFTISGGYMTQIGAQNVGTQQMFAATTFHYADNVTIIHGRHVMKAGGQFLRYWQNAFFAGTNGRSGGFTFDGHYTSVRASAAAFADADMFLGLPAIVNVGVQTGPWGQRTNSFGIFFQDDDWRVTDSLTLNMGLRWAYQSPLVEVADRQANIQMYTGKLLLAGKDGNSRALYNPFLNDYQPRVGFAWTPAALGKKTVIRGAYGISSYFEGTGTAWRLTLSVPFNRELETRSVGSAAFNSRLSDGLLPLGTSVNPNDPYRNLTLRMWDPNNRPANVQQCNFTVEEQLPGNSVLSVGYVGQHGNHLFTEVPYSQKVLQSNGTTLLSPYYAGNPLLYSAARTTGQASLANQKYNSLQASWTKRLSRGLQAQLSYTWSKAMSDSPGFYGETGQGAPQAALPQNLYNWKAEWGPATFDLRHSFTASYTYELPSAATGCSVRA